MKSSCLLLLLCFVVACVSQGGELVENTGPQVLGPLAGIEAISVFPKNTARQFHVSDVSKVYVAFINGLTRHINITHMTGYISPVGDYHTVVQNFTKNPYGINTPPGVSVALDFEFKFEAMTEAQSYNLILQVYYRDNNKNHSDTAFNGTITVIDSEESAVVQDFFLLVGAVVLLGLIVYYSFSYASGSSSGRTRSRPKASSRSEKGTSTVDQDWLAGTAAAQKRNTRKSPKQKKGKRK